MTIGESIKQIRISKGWTQKQLGEACIPKMNEANIRKYENGNAEPGLKVLRRLAQALDVSISDLSHDFDTTSNIEEDKIKIATAKIYGTNTRIENIIEIGSMMSELNDEGQKKAIEQVKLLTLIPEYKDEEYEARLSKVVDHDRIRNYYESLKNSASTDTNKAL